MTARFFITIDTEEDDWGEYRSSGFSVANIEIIPRLQTLFERYGAVPTYLITYPVVTSATARSVFLEILARNRCEIGAHCHPWNTPPFEEEINARNSMICNLPYSTVIKKVTVLKSTIAESLGVTPRCFRSGRWGFGPNVAAAIYELGFRIDTSVTPFVDWTEYAGPDYREAPFLSYQFNPPAIQSAAPNGRLLEVPPTIGFLQTNYELCRRVIKWRRLASRLRLMGALEKFGLLNLRWLSPELSSGDEMVALAKTALSARATHLNMTFHSTSLLPGKSPYVSTQAALESFLGNIETMLKFAANEGFVFLPLSAALENNSPASAFA